MSTYENFKLSVEELKQIEECVNMNEEKVLEVIETMFMMSVFAFNAYCKEKNAVSYE